MAKDDFTKLGFTAADYEAPPPITPEQRQAIEKAISAAELVYRDQESVMGLNVHGDQNKIRPSHIAKGKVPPNKPSAADSPAAAAGAK